jgi:hypothetical protein
MEATRPPEMLVFYCNITGCHKPEDLNFNWPVFVKFGMTVTLLAVPTHSSYNNANTGTMHTSEL